MTTIVYHSADFDGIFCREIAKHFLGPGPEQEPNQYLGWNFGDPPINPMTIGETLYVMDLPLDQPFGFRFSELIKDPAYIGKPNRIGNATNIVWIDHHKTSIDSAPAEIPGYRIDGVAACRLAWQYFTLPKHSGPGTGYEALKKHNFVDRQVTEPLAVRLAGEYDVWDHRGDGDLEFQFGLRTIELTPQRWTDLLDIRYPDGIFVDPIIERGRVAKAYAEHVDADLVTYKSFRVKWEGLDFLCLNHGRFNSLTFAALDKPETGHDALLGFFFNGREFVVSLYHAGHRKDLDLSAIAKKYGGGGHKGACGFQCNRLPFV